jgi:hypothetical protein
MSQPMDRRANNDRIKECFMDLQSMRVEQFIPEDAKLDLESAGLQPPELTLAFKQGTNTSLVLEFGKSPADHPQQLYARRSGQSTIVTVSSNLVQKWFVLHSHNFADFIDPHLLSLTRPPDLIEVRAKDDFALQRQSTNSWRVTPPGVAADPGLVNELIGNLNGMLVTLEKGIVTDLPPYGLDKPSLSYSFQISATDAGTGATNRPIAKLDFGTNDAKVFARNPDEASVYAVAPEDYQRLERLTGHGWQMRDRRIWNFSEDDVVRITVQTNGKTRGVVRTGTNAWALATGSQGLINPFAVEETAHMLGELRAGVWVEHSDENRAAYGFTSDGLKVTIELKTGEKLSAEFGGRAPSGYYYAIVALDGQPWIFEFPFSTYDHLKFSVPVSAGTP